MTATQQPPAPDSGNHFIQTLKGLSKGSLAPQLSDELSNLVREVNETKRKGSLKLTLTVRPTGGEGGQISIHSDVEMRLPKADPGVSIFYASKQGQLLRSNPDNQD